MAISLEQAQTIATASLAKARELALKPVSVVVLDPRATLVVVYSEDGVSTLRPRIAQGKANAAIAMGMGTRALMARAPNNKPTSFRRSTAWLRAILCRYPVVF